MIDDFTGPYRFLSNFWPARVCLDGAEYPTVEHAYQAAKTLGYAAREWIRKSGTPGRAKRRGKQVPVRADWDTVRVDTMRRLLAQKFASGSDLAARLLATGDSELVEGNAWGDRFWGVSGGTGQNWLGRLLMERRAVSRKG